MAHPRDQSQKQNRDLCSAVSLRGTSLLGGHSTSLSSLRFNKSLILQYQCKFHARLKFQSRYFIQYTYVIWWQFGSVSGKNHETDIYRQRPFISVSQASLQSSTPSEHRSPIFPSFNSVHSAHPSFFTKISLPFLTKTCYSESWEQHKEFGQLTSSLFVNV